MGERNAEKKKKSKKNVAGTFLVVVFCLCPFFSVRTLDSPTNTLFYTHANNHTRAPLWAADSDDDSYVPPGQKRTTRSKSAAAAEEKKNEVIDLYSSDDDGLEDTPPVRRLLFFSKLDVRYRVMTM